MKGTHTGCFCIMSSLSNLHCCILLAFFDSFVVDPILGNPFLQTMERDKTFISPYFVEGMPLFQFSYMRYWATAIVHQS